MLGTEKRGPRKLKMTQRKPQSQALIYMLHTVRTKKALYNMSLGNDSFPKKPMSYFLVRERLLNEVAFARW